MRQEVKNTFLATAIIAGIISIPMIWMNLQRPTHSGQISVNDWMYVSGPNVVTGLEGKVSLLGETLINMIMPIWLIVVTAISASVVQLMRNSTTFIVPQALKWGLAGMATIWVALLIVEVGFSGASDKMSLGLGSIVGFYSATIPLMTLSISTKANSRMSATAEDESAQ